MPGDVALLNPSIKGALGGLRHPKPVSQPRRTPFVSSVGQVVSVVSLGVGSFAGDAKSGGGAKQLRPRQQLLGWSLLGPAALGDTAGLGNPVIIHHPPLFTVLQTAWGCWGSWKGMSPRAG